MLEFRESNDRAKSHKCDLVVFQITTLRQDDEVGLCNFHDISADARAEIRGEVWHQTLWKQITLGKSAPFDLYPKIAGRGHTRNRRSFRSVLWPAFLKESPVTI